MRRKKNQSSLKLRIGIGVFLAALILAGLVWLRFWVDQKADASSAKIAIQAGGNASVAKNGTSYMEANWKDLVQLDYNSGARGADLRRFENKLVRIPGYIVPLTDDVSVLDEFLFVPNDQACIHVPPPPPNLIIKAKLRNKLAFEDVFNPSWLYGKLEITGTKSQYGSAAYQINDAELEKYEDTAR